MEAVVSPFSAALNGGVNVVLADVHAANLEGNAGIDGVRRSIHTAYRELVKAYLRVVNANPEEGDATAKYGRILRAVIAYQVNYNADLDAINRPPEEINVEAVNCGQLVAFVTGPLGGIHINLQDIVHTVYNTPNNLHGVSQEDVVQPTSPIQVNRAEKVSVTKRLSHSDVSDHIGRLALPKSFVTEKVTPLLKDDENVENGINVTVYDNQLQEFDMVFKSLAGGKPFVLRSTWNKFRHANDLKVNTEVEICAFRHFMNDDKLCFAVFTT